MSSSTHMSPGFLRRGSDVREVLGFPPLAELPARAQVSDAVFDEYLLRLASELANAARFDAARTFLLTTVSEGTHVAPLAELLETKLREMGIKARSISAAAITPPPPDYALHNSAQAELWQQGYVAARIEQLRSEHDLVLLSAEPLWVSTQAGTVASCADVTVLVVECGVGTREELEQAASLLTRIHARGVAAVAAEISLQDADPELREAVAALETAAEHQSWISGQVLRHSQTPAESAAREPARARPESPLGTSESSVGARSSTPAPAPSGTPQPRVAQAYSAGSTPVETSSARPSREEKSTVDASFSHQPAHSWADQDQEALEPAPDQASSHLLTGRWDPIPTLRQQVPSWRERATAVAPGAPPATRQAIPDERLPGQHAEAFEEEASREQRTAFEASAEYQAEPLRESLLTRQWGLLSQFQQDRLSTEQKRGASPVRGAKDSSSKDESEDPSAQR